MEGGSGDGRETETVVNVPRDVRVVRELLRSMGMAEGDYEPRVVHQFLALCYRYVVDVLSDAQVYAEHAGKSIIDPDDVRLAIQSRANFSSARPPPREVLMELARHGNKRPLPKTIAPPGSMPLPPEEDTLISPSYQLIIPVKQPAQAGEIEEEEEDVPSITSNSNPNTNTNSSQEQRTDAGLQQQLPQRVSFPFIPAAAATAKRQR